MKSYIFSLILSFYNPNEINVGKSIDWMCYEANTIITVKIDTVSPGNMTSMDYVQDPYIQVTVTEVYKGSKPKLDKITLYPASGQAYIFSIKKMEKKEVLVFVKDMISDKCCSYAILDDTYGIMEVNSPADRALTGDFRMLKKKDELTTKVKDCVKQLEGKTAKPYYLEVPFDTEAHGALYAGSSCFLIVPDVLYPNAKKGIH